MRGSCPKPSFLLNHLVTLNMKSNSEWRVGNLIIILSITPWFLLTKRMPPSKLAEQVNP